MSIATSVSFLIYFVGLGTPVPKSQVIRYYEKWVPDKKAKVEAVVRGLPELITPTMVSKEPWPKGIRKSGYRAAARRKWANV